jgi:hypothetical protein
MKPVLKRKRKAVLSTIQRIVTVDVASCIGTAQQQAPQGRG